MQTLFVDAPQPHFSFISRCQSNTMFAKPLESNEPSEYDVVCGRGKGSYNRPGNKRFRAIAQEYVPEYLAARSRLDKSSVLNKIVHVVQENGRFLKYSKKEGWFVISHELAREKVGHAIREAMATFRVWHDVLDTSLVAGGVPSSVDAVL